MELEIFLRGLFLGLAIAAPVGPIGLLCIRRTLESGHAAGFVTGLGAASADAVYGAVAATGLSVVAELLLSHHAWMRLFGGLFLVLIGGRTMAAKSAPSRGSASRAGFFGAYASALFLTLANPLTILSFAAMFAGIGVVASTGSRLALPLLVLGVFTGSTLWWLVLSGATTRLSARLAPAHMLWINRVSGAVFILFGMSALVSILR